MIMIPEDNTFLTKAIQSARKNTLNPAVAAQQLMANST
jgi:hypothetical protein